METTQDTLLDWLRDAHAMEQQAEKILTSFCDRLQHYPQLKSRIEDHAQVTRMQQQLLKECIEREGSSTSAVKDLGAKFMGFSQSISGMFASDEVVKGTMSIYVFEQMEIASYTILIAAARMTNNIETQSICERIRQQEIAMANWLGEHLPEITESFLARSQAPGSTAKR